MLPTDPASTPRRPLAWIWALTLAAGLGGGLLAWLGGEATLDAIKPPKHAVNSKGMILQIADRWDETTAEARNAALAFAILGGAVGTCFGLAGGLASRSWRRAIGAGFLGLGLGVAGSAAVGAAILSPYNAYRYQNPDEASRDLLLPLLVHASIWAVAGGAGGLAWGVGSGFTRSQPRLMVRTAIGGLIGALLGTMAIELGGSLVLDGYDGGKLVASTSTARLLGRLAVALGTGVGVAYALTDQRGRRPQDTAAL